MFIIIKLASGDRISRAYSSLDEALVVLGEIVVGDDPLDPRAFFGVQEIDEAADHVGEPVLLPLAA